MTRNNKTAAVIAAIFVIIGAGIFFGYKIIPNKKIARFAAEQPGNASTISSSVTELRNNSQELLAIVDNQDPAAALRELQRRMDTNPLVFKNCHELAHEIGHEAVKKYGNFGTALKYQNTTCSDGYLHGIIEETFGEHASDISPLMKKMGMLCDGLQGLTQRCYHGIGHAMMFYTENNLPQSLVYCEHYQGVPRDRCYEGVFMQNFISDPDLHPSIFVDAKHPFYPCPREPAVYRPYCYFYAPIFYLNQNNNDYAKALEWCQTEKTGYAADCTKGVGSLIVKYDVKDPLLGQKLCAATPFVRSCIAGMVSYGLTFYGKTSDVQAYMCDRMDADYQILCEQDLTKEVHLF